jgi:serine/threonine-protein kinase
VSDGSASDRARWQRVDEVFAAALEQPAEQRSDFLARTCGGDAELRREVESLLVHAREDGFLGVPATAEARRLLADTRPEPLAGQRLGRFEVLAKLGAGGMGEVYLAHDPKLERRVALKLLPGHLAADPDRIRRFRREALAVSALNHPNILTVHEVVEADGREVMVSELVEGVTLRDRLRDGPLPIATALDLAVQCARALAAAHGVGIAHRDVKPENVMIRDDGLVKLLDFGIATSPAPGRGAATPTRSPTHLATATGVILGTACYMSPEQARGERAEKQTDIWALGCVLYEALTGRQAFPGPTVSDVVAAILTREPDWEALPAETPWLARSVLRRCLQRNRELRLQDAGDVRLELEEAAREPIVAAAAGTALRRWLPMPVVWAATAALIVVAASSGWQLGRAGGRQPVLPDRFHLLPPPGVELVRENSATLAISRDGRSVVFVGQAANGEAKALYVRRVDELAARPLAGTEGATTPFLSPDGEWVGFYSRGALRKVSMAGGEPLTICAAPLLRGASWGEDGAIVYSSGEGSLVRVAATGGEPAPLTRPAPGHQHRWPQHLPGGRTIVFQNYRGLGEARHEITALSLESGEQRTLLRGGSHPRYANGQLVFGRLGTLYAVPFDPEKLALGGEPRAVLDDLWFFAGSSVRAYDLAASGALVFSPGAPRLRDRELVEIDRQGRVARAAQRRAPFYDDLSVSRDGRLAVAIRSRLEEAELWSWDPAGDRWTRLTTQGWMLGSGSWSRDDRWIFVSMVVEGSPKVFRIAADGSGVPRQLTASGWKWEYPTSISPDDTTLLLLQVAGAGGLDLFSLDLSTGDPPRPLIVAAQYEGGGDFSPDGRHFAFFADYGGTLEVYVRPYPGQGRQVRVSDGGGMRPRWSPRGDEIFYFCPHAEAADPGICAVPVTPGDERTFGPPRRLFDLPAGMVREFAVAPDGKSIYAVRLLPEAASEARLVYAPSWIDELTTTQK